MAAIAVIHVGEKSLVLAASEEKGAASGYETANSVSGDISLFGSLPISSAPADGILSARVLATRPIHIFTERVLAMRPIHILTECVLAMRPIHILTECVLAMRPIRIFTECVLATRPIHILTECVLATRPIRIFTERVLAMRPIRIFTERVLAMLAPHIRKVLPAGVLTGVWQRTYPEERLVFFGGMATLDPEIGNIPKAALTQVCAPRSMSSGKAAVLCSLLAQATDAEEVCALIDASGCFNPSSAVTAGVDLSRLLWVRCGKKMKAGFAEKSTGVPHPTAGHHATADRDARAVRDATTNPGMPTDLHTTNGHHATTGGALADYQSMTDGHAMNGRPSITSRGAIPGCLSITSSQAPMNDPVPIGRQSLKNSQADRETEAVKSINGGTRRREADNRMAHTSNCIAPASNRIATSNFRGADARRMQPVEQAFKAADILIQNGGFGLIAIDLGEIEERLVRKIPLTTWFRFARVIERQPTALVVFATYPAAQSCAALTLHIKTASARWHADAHTHAQFLSGLACEVELGNARGRGRGRKPAQSAKAGFTAKPVWK